MIFPNRSGRDNRGTMTQTTTWGSKFLTVNGQTFDRMGQVFNGLKNKNPESGTTLSGEQQDVSNNHKKQINVKVFVFDFLIFTVLSFYYLVSK